MADFSQIVTSLQRQAGYAVQQAKAAADAVRGLEGGQALIRQEMAQNIRDMQNLASALKGLGSSDGSGGGGFGNGNVSDHVRYIESIPGRRVPFDLVVSIPIGATTISVQQGTKTISQDGPFVAVARYATFQSAFQFARRDPTTQAQAAFQGRSFGRFRPVHSAWDLSDGQPGYQPITGIAAPGTGAPIVASPSNHSSFRTMEFDGVFKMLNQGSGYPRSNEEVPSAFWSESINSPFQLGSLDFFERGETIQWEVRPTHVNNPPAGNLSGYAAGGLYPFLSSQYDVHEGVSDPLDPDATTDPITRLADGILVIGLHGFKIIQPPGPVRLT
jgi:hypothetical protein